MDRFRAMLAELAPAPFDSEKHLFEPKWDGVRCAAYVVPGGRHRLQGRNGADLTPLFPELEGAFDVSTIVATDGELVCGDGSMKTFPLIAGRVHRSDAFAIKMASRQNPATYRVFDIMQLGELDVIRQPLWQRKPLLATNVRETDRVKLTPFFEKEGLAFFEVMQSQGYEGMMAKHRDGPYLPGKRSSYWLKVKLPKEASFFAVALTPGQGSRSATFGALVLVDDSLNYRGEVGTGFSEADLAQICALVKDGPPLDIPVKDVRWIQPIRCRVKFLDETADGKLRFPVFVPERR